MINYCAAKKVDVLKITLIRLQREINFVVLLFKFLRFQVCMYKDTRLCAIAGKNETLVIDSGTNHNIKMILILISY